MVRCQALRRFKKEDVRQLIDEGFEQVTACKWANYCRHVVDLENKWHQRDNITPAVQPVVVNLHDAVAPAAQNVAAGHEALGGGPGHGQGSGNAGSEGGDAAASRGSAEEQTHVSVLSVRVLVRCTLLVCERLYCVHERCVLAGIVVGEGRALALRVSENQSVNKKQKK